MRISKETLARVIHEEVRKGLRESSTMQVLDPADLVAFAEAWQSLGGPTQEQVKQVLNGDVQYGSMVLTSAIERALEALRGFNEQLDEMLRDYIAEANGDDWDPSEEYRGDGMHPEEQGDDDWRYD